MRAILILSLFMVPLLILQFDPLRKQPAYPLGFLDTFDADAEGTQAHGEFLFAGQPQDLGGGVGPSESFFKIERARNSCISR